MVNRWSSHSKQFNEYRLIATEKLLSLMDAINVQTALEKFQMNDVSHLDG